MRAILIALVCVFSAAPSFVSAGPLLGLPPEPASKVYSKSAWVLYGTLKNPNPEKKTTELHIERVLKADAQLGDRKMVLLPRCIEIAEAGSAMKCVAFFEKHRDKMEYTYGWSSPSSAMLDYLQGMAQQQGNDPLPRLAFLAKHIDSADSEVNEEVFRELVRTTDADLVRMGKTLDPTRLRKLLKPPLRERERFGLFAYMLGICGDASDTAWFRSMLSHVGDESKSEWRREGVLNGYVTLSPQEGWKATCVLLRQKNLKFLDRYCALQTARFLWKNRPGLIAKDELVKGLLPVLDQRDMADFVIDDLRAWKRWETVDRVLDLYAKKSHDATIIKKSILYYALVCPEKRAVEFVCEMRKKDAELVKDTEELLKYDSDNGK